MWPARVHVLTGLHEPEQWSDNNIKPRKWRWKRQTGFVSADGRRRRLTVDRVADNVNDNTTQRCVTREEGWRWLISMRWSAEMSVRCGDMPFYLCWWWSFLSLCIQTQFEFDRPLSKTCEMLSTKLHASIQTKYKPHRTQNINQSSALRTRRVCVCVMLLFFLHRYTHTRGFIKSMHK